MHRVEIEAVEDRSRAEGGHAVVLLRGVTAAPDSVRLRLRPVEVDRVPADAASRLAGDLAPLAAVATDDGLALTLGPDITGNPALIPGTAVEIVLPDLEVRGDFLWRGRNAGTS